MPLKQLVEKREELNATQAKLSKIYGEAKGDPAGNSNELDLSLVKSIEGDSTQKLDAIRKLQEKANDLGKEVDALALIDAGANDIAREHEVKGGDTDRSFGLGADNQGEPKGLGDLFCDSAQYKAWRAKGDGVGWNGFKAEIKAEPAKIVKATFTTSAGWAPESIRIGRVIEAATRPIQVIDTVPGGQTTQAAIVYMEETTFTPAAAERAEEGAYPEATFALTERTSNVRSIGARVPVTDEQLEDEPQARSYLNQRLGFGVRQRLDGQLLVGGGTGSDLTGLNNVSSILTQAKGADPTPDAVYKAMRQVRVTGRAMPNVVYAHPNDWEDIRLLRTADGVYIWGNPSESGPMRLWGVMVVETDAQTENTMLTADTANFTQLFMRRDLVIEIGLNASDFSLGRQTIRAGLRAAFVAYRADAIATITGV